ncbi:cytochrome P450 [Dinoroseobacter sp. S124A]|uniref:cytochrome P450 n=1 Tax=Dinoroseobacter sp. S124A TaxID=3415128 RepID=UPI003C7CCCE6
MTLQAPKPAARAEKVSLWRYLQLFRRDILSAQPARLYRAWMAEFRTPFFRSYLVNDPEILREVLSDRPEDFPKSDRIGEGLRPLLGDSVFLTNGADWARQRRIIDPAFERGRVKDSFADMQASAGTALARLAPRAAADLVEIEEVCAHAAADVIFRTLFSVPIEDEVAGQVFAAFRAHQRSQPILNLGAFLPLPRWLPRGHRRATQDTARHLRRLITELTEARAAEIATGRAPRDLATKIMTTPDPETGARFSTDEMVDQVAIFFLAGHETSGSALAWALYLLAAAPEIQDRVRAELADLDPCTMAFADLSRLRLTRDVYREALRLYPPVPMMVREAQKSRRWRDRAIRKGAQVVLSPWHLHRHTRLWSDPDGFDPDRWQREETRESQRQAYMPFSAGPRVCPGAGFAMAEGTLLLAALVKRFAFTADPAHVPVPEAHLTVRARHGIWLRVEDCAAQPGAGPDPSR